MSTSSTASVRALTCGGEGQRVCGGGSGAGAGAAAGLEDEDEEEEAGERDAARQGEVVIALVHVRGGDAGEESVHKREEEGDHQLHDGARQDEHGKAHQEQLLPHLCRDIDNGWLLNILGDTFGVADLLNDT